MTQTLIYNLDTNAFENTVVFSNAFTFKCIKDNDSSLNLSEVSINNATYYCYNKSEMFDGFYISNTKLSNGNVIIEVLNNNDFLNEVKDLMSFEWNFSINDKLEEDLYQYFNIEKLSSSSYEIYPLFSLQEDYIIDIRVKIFQDDDLNDFIYLDNSIYFVQNNNFYLKNKFSFDKDEIIIRENDELDKELDIYYDNLLINELLDMSKINIECQIIYNNTYYDSIKYCRLENNKVKFFYPKVNINTDYFYQFRMKIWVVGTDRYIYTPICYLKYESSDFNRVAHINDYLINTTNNNNDYISITTDVNNISVLYDVMMYDNSKGEYIKIDDNLLLEKQFILNNTCYRKIRNIQ